MGGGTWAIVFLPCVNRERFGGGWVGGSLEAHPHTTPVDVGGYVGGSNRPRPQRGISKQSKQKIFFIIFVGFDFNFRQFVNESLISFDVRCLAGNPRLAFQNVQQPVKPLAR